MTTSSPSRKKPKLNNDDDDDKTLQQAWEHYRNYLDSLEATDQGGGDVDELHELVELLSPHETTKIYSIDGNTLDNIHSTKDLMPLLISAAYYHLAEAAVADYLHATAHKIPSQVGTMADQAQLYITKSLQACPTNPAIWSMGANFGRISHRLDPHVTLEWYEQAVHWATRWRRKALELLEDDSVQDMTKEWVELLILNQVLGVEFEVDGDDDDDESEQDEEKEDSIQIDKEDEEEEEGHYSASIVEGTARFMCAMLSSILGKHTKAASHLQHFDLTHRLHPNVWKIASNDDNMSSGSEIPSRPPLVFRPKEGILPEQLYNNMKKVFAPDAAYWKQSDYANRGYYSYFMEYNDDKLAPRNLIEDVIVNYLLPRAKQVLSNEEGDSICGFEWWTHTRHIEANLGHNLHFDTDESILAQEGKISHPILSSVLYLTGGNHKGAPGGATILLDQTPESKQVARHCWQGIPFDNSFLLFPGNLLHGVLPCPGTNEQVSKETPKPKDLWTSWKADSTEPKESRLTFMVGFWTRNVPKSMKKKPGLYAPCGPLPPPTEEHTWVKEIQAGYGENGMAKDVMVQGQDPPTPMSLPKVSPAWDTIDPLTTDDPDSPSLSIPYAIDHRFFVKDAPDCFRQSLMEDKDC